MEMKKLCKGCYNELTLNLFSKAKNEKDGLQRRCKNCNSKQGRENSHKRAEYLKEYQIKNKSCLLNKRRLYESKRNKDPKIRVLNNIRSYTSIVVRRKGMIKSRKALDYIGCSIDIFINHLENQFKEGMLWDNYGKWEIDHIVPISTANSIDEVYNLNHYTNLQPMWKSDNARKSNKLWL
jgi:hypothetical protein